MHNILGSFKLSRKVPTPQFAQDNGFEVFNVVLDEPIDSDISRQVINKTIEYNTELYKIVDSERFNVNRPLFQFSFYAEKIKEYE